MHARMSRLRRSLSRSSIFGTFNKSQLSLIDDLRERDQQQSNDIQHSLLVNRFSTPNTFAQLRQLVQTNNEILREIIAIFNERVSLDFAYAKTMHKLSARLHKISQTTNGVIDEGWTCVAEQFESQATIHSNLGSAIADDIVQPLRSIFHSQNQTIRTSEQSVERELKKLSERRTEANKIKRHLYSSSRDLEKLDQLIDNDKSANVKLCVKKRKLLEQVSKYENAYLNEIYEAEKQRRITDGVLRRSVQRLEIVEKQRLAHCQTALGRFQRKIAQLGPNLNLMFERHMNALDGAVNADPLNVIDNLKPSCSAHHTVYVCDFYAENFGEVMNGDRRRWALERASALLHDHLDEHQQQVSDIQAMDVTKFSLSEFVEFLTFKVDESLRSLDGTQNREFHRLAQFQQKTKDKMGLPQTLLIIPLTEQSSNFPVTKSPSLPTTSSTDEYEYEQIYGCGSDAANASSSSRDAVINNNQNHQSNGKMMVDDKTKQICRVLYDFNANSDEEIDIRAGDCVIVEGRLSDDWLIGYTISDLSESNAVSKIGRFPASYVT